ncbi:MAG: Brp/Blh family beta-carotene 15,15'-dioxygenase [Flavobacteriales bacterium]
MIASKRVPFLFTLAALYVLTSIAFPNFRDVADWIFGGILGLGLVAVGIPHGALDVWTHRHRNSAAQSLRYIALYLVAIGGVFAFWMTFPLAGLFVFLALSAWHFGQADFELWGMRRGSFAWGWLALSMILIWNVSEVNGILAHMGIEPVVLQWIELNVHPFQWVTVAAWFVAAARAIQLKKWEWLWTLGMLVWAPWMPVLWAFGLYFIGQHSVAGWTHLQLRMNKGGSELWRLALPFTLGAWALIAAGIWVLTSAFVLDTDATAGAFFVLLGSISIPHIFESHLFLRNGASG